MSGPVIVPQTPVINQSDSPEQIARVAENVQKIFDKVSPKIRGTPTPESPPEPKKPDQTPTEPVKVSTEKETKTAEPAIEQSKPSIETPEHKIPSFIEEALKVEPVKSEEKPVADEEWPAELPEFKSSDEAKTRYKSWRGKYQALKDEAKKLRERPVVDETTTQRLQFLENQNKELTTVLSRTNVEQHREFQEKILRPMHGAYNEAARIVNEAGGDPQDLAKALALSGKAQFEALDTIFEGMPESAKTEAHEAIRAFRRFDEQRKRALADAPKTAQALQKADLERQYSMVSKQKEEMKNLFENAITQLRDEAKVEVLQKSNDPDSKWWNDQADELVDTARKLYLDNTDMSRVAMACVLAPMADTYRKLFLAERAARMKSEGILKDKFGSEPNLSESGGAARNGTPVEEDLKKPFADVFLREFHKQREAGAR